MRKMVIKEKDKPDDSLQFWRNKTSEERLEAVEILREQFYIIQGHTSTPRLERVLKLVDR